MALAAQALAVAREVHLERTQMLVRHDLADGGRQEGVVREDRDAGVYPRHSREPPAVVRLVDHAVAKEALGIEVQVGRQVIVQIGESAAARGRGRQRDQIGRRIIAAAAVGDRLRLRGRADAQHEGRKRAVRLEVPPVKRRGGRHPAVDQPAEGGDRRHGVRQA